MSLETHKPLISQGFVCISDGVKSSGRYRARTCDLQRVMRCSARAKKPELSSTSSSLADYSIVATVRIKSHIIAQNRGSAGTKTEASVMSAEPIAAKGKLCPQVAFYD